MGSTGWSDNPAAEEVDPPWGWLPSEQYLIHHWDSSSPEPTTQQYERLIRAYLDLDEIPEEWLPLDGTRVPPDRLPTDAEITSILAPWRPKRAREFASHLQAIPFGEAVVMLRTHYDDEPAARDAHDEQLQEWLADEVDSDPMIDEEYHERRVLDDPALFDFGGDWERIFTLVPEISSGGDVDRWTSEREIREAQDRVRLRIEEGGEELRAQYGSDEELLEAMGEPLQYMMERVLLFVVDKEAFETGKLKALTLDPYGDVVRHCRVQGGYDHCTMREIYIQGRDGMWITECEMGEKYRASGEEGKDLYGVERILGNKTNKP